MDGLECTEIMYSALKTDNPTLRYDSEFFSKHYAQVTELVSKQSAVKLGEVTSWITQGPNPAFSAKGTIPCLTGRNIASGRVNYCEPDYIDDDEYYKLRRFQLMPGDTLITLKGKGSIGKIGYVTDSRKSIFSRNIGIVRPNRIDAAYMNAFLMSKYGHDLVLRGETGGTGQTTLTTAHLKLIDIPVFDVLQHSIKGLLEQSEKADSCANGTYLQAERFLLQSLGVENFITPKSSYATKRLSASYLLTKRLDAEYYHPKYEAYENSLHTLDTVNTLCNVYDNNFAPNYSTDYSYIELSNVGASGDIIGINTVVGSELPSRARRQVKAGQVIVSSVEGSLQSCALIPTEYNDALCSTGFYVVDSNCINSETLLVLFKSAPIQALLKQRCSGTILTAISKDQFQRMPLPRVNDDVQKEIASLVRSSFSLRYKSEVYLEHAKLAVEVAIEQGEKAAIEWLKTEGVEN